MPAPTTADLVLDVRAKIIQLSTLNHEAALGVLGEFGIQRFSAATFPAEKLLAFRTRIEAVLASLTAKAGAAAVA
jgi:hypothetical protein